MSTNECCEAILRVVASQNKISPEEIIYGGNKRELAYPRQQYFWICAKIKHRFPPGQMSWRQIGNYVNRHYSTAIMQSSTLDSVMSVMKKLKSDMDKIIEALVMENEVFTPLVHESIPIIGQLRISETKGYTNKFSYIPMSKNKFATV
ncbi:MAG TPA: hypothetical protein DCF44_06910 [Chitinophagaceae bacterium]|nr:hypothetical protein [Chitinophagaceae bacterium]